MTALLPDTLSLLALLSLAGVLWVVMGRLILDVLAGEAVHPCDNLDTHDPGTPDWRRRPSRRARNSGRRQCAADTAHKQRAAGAAPRRAA